MSIDPRRTQPFPTCECINKECRCSRWPDYRNRWGLPVNGGGVAEPTYADKVLSYGPIAYWPLWETSGTVAECLVNPLQNGTYINGPLVGTGTGPDASPCPWFDGLNDFVNVFSATLAAGFSGTLGTAAGWARVHNVGVWTDGSFRAAAWFAADGNNRSLIEKFNTNNDLYYQHRAGAIVSSVTRGATAETGWMHVAVTWNKAANQMKAYYQGAQTGLTQAIAGIWAGALGATTTCLAASSTAAAFPWHGWLAHWAVWNIALSQPDILDLATA